MHRECPRGSISEDDGTGDLVCRNCGLVLGQVYMDTSPTPWTEFTAAPLSFGGPPKTANEYQARETIMNVCSHLHLDTTCLVDSAMSIWRELNSDSSRPARARFSMTNTKCRAMLAYAIMEALNRQCTPRSPELICQACDVTVGDMLKLEGVCGNVLTYCEPHHYVDTACAILGLPFWMTKLVVELAVVTQKTNFGFKPEPLVAACIWSILCSVRSAIGPNTVPNEINENHIYDMLGVKKRTALTWMKKLPEYELRKSKTRPFDFICPVESEMGSDGEGDRDTQ